MKSLLFLKMKDIGKPFGLSSQKVGRLLLEHGYRTSEGHVTLRALEDGMAIVESYSTGKGSVPDVYWNKRKVSSLLKQSGLVELPRS